MSIDPHENDYELTEALGRHIRLRRLEDVIPGEDYVLHASYWWRVLGEGRSAGTLDLEIAGPGSPENPETSVLVGDEGSLLVTASASSGLQFQSGRLLDVLWPCCGLIYVKRAIRRGVGIDPEERVFGIFALRYDADGSPYYAPVDQKFQPGVASGWLLDPRLDLIFSWEPVDVAKLLREYGGGGRD